MPVHLDLCFYTVVIQLFYCLRKYLFSCPGALASLRRTVSHMWFVTWSWHQSFWTYKDFFQGYLVCMSVCTGDRVFVYVCVHV